MQHAPRHACIVNLRLTGEKDMSSSGPALSCSLLMRPMEHRLSVLWHTLTHLMAGTLQTCYSCLMHFLLSSS